MLHFIIVLNFYVLILVISLPESSQNRWDMIKINKQTHLASEVGDTQIRSSDEDLNKQVGSYGSRWSFKYSGPKPYQALFVKTSTLTSAWKQIGSQ